jgi:hypothetical protein
MNIEKTHHKDTKRTEVALRKPKSDSSFRWERVYEAGGEVNEKSTDSSKGPASEAAGRTQASFFVGMHDLK